MRLTVIITFIIALMMCTTAEARPEPRCNDARQGIQFYRDTTWNAQLALGIARTPYGGAEDSASCRYVVWAAHLWRERSSSSSSRLRELNGNPKKAICYVFGEYCAQALQVSGCETGHTYHIHAQNGQYLGMFQMGYYARSVYGHGNTALEQARAAYGYFVNSGRDWSPWSCKPWR